MKALQTHPGTPRAGNAPVLPFGRCILQIDLQHWVMEMCRAFLASLGTAEDWDRSSRYPQAHGGLYSTLLYQGEIGSIGFFFLAGDLREFAGEKVAGPALNLGL